MNSILFKAFKRYISLIWKNMDSLEDIIGSKEKQTIEIELNNEKTFEYAGFLYCNNKYCTVVIQG